MLVTVEMVRGIFQHTVMELMEDLLLTMRSKIETLFKRTNLVNQVVRGRELESGIEIGKKIETAVLGTTKIEVQGLIVERADMVIMTVTGMIMTGYYKYLCHAYSFDFYIKAQFGFDFYKYLYAFSKIF